MAAKDGTLLEVEGPEPFIGLAGSFFKGLINQLCQDEWMSRWSSTDGSLYRQTRHWFPQLDPAMSKKLINLSRAKLGLLVQLFTGHNFMMRHENILDPNVDPTCRLCCEDDESSEHIVAQCPAIWAERLVMWDEYAVQIPPFENWDLKRLLGFLSNANIAELFDPSLD